MRQEAIGDAIRRAQTIRDGMIYRLSTIIADRIKNHSRGEWKQQFIELRKDIKTEPKLEPYEIDQAFKTAKTILEILFPDRTTGSRTQ